MSKWFSDLTRNNTFSRLPQYALPIALGLMVVVLMTAPGPLAYDRALVQAGDLWRLLTGNFVHLNWPHALLNLSGLVLAMLLHGRHYQPARYATLIVVCSLCVTVGLWLFNPEVVAYVGLSGVLHGLLAWGAASDIEAKVPLGWVLAVGLAVKLLFEWQTGASSLTEEMIAAPVISAAHIYGATGGVALFFVQRFLRRLCR